MVTSRSVSIEIQDGGIYHTKKRYWIFLSGKFVKETDEVIASIFGLYPETEYRIEVRDEHNTVVGTLCVVTEEESATLDVREFGAKGDGIQDDTPFLQAAFLCCPENGRVLIENGVYRITSLFLKSGISVEIAGNAKLMAIPDREKYPILPGMLKNKDGREAYYLGTWEGEPAPMFSGILCGVGVKNVTIYGEGTVDGAASFENWWNNPKQIRDASRPRLFFLNHCQNIRVQGLKLQNSPSWTIHPFFSRNLLFCHVEVRNPPDSPNTDGIDPESCKNVEICGMKFSLGDDCIAIKSGKVSVGKAYRIPCEKIRVHQCLMERGHGAVTIGSENAGGVKEILVENCLFSHTDRGLRIKTRRGRGKDSVLDEICFRNLKMNHVMTPFVVNAFYFCDSDGKTEYVQSRETLPVDERTPEIRRLSFENIEAENCHVAAAYFEGLPEQKIREIKMKNVRIAFADQPKTGIPAMALGVEPCSRKGLIVKNVENLILENVDVFGDEPG